MPNQLIGQMLLNQYRVDAFIAAGGMGAVYKVWDIKRNVPLAMKVLHAELAEDPHMYKRFQREANALKKLAHPNIVPFYGIFQAEGFAFLLESYIDGITLKELLRRRQGQPLPIHQSVNYLNAITAALGYAHSRGVVHCDIKPGNIMVDQGGWLYLTDFGIARHAESTTTTVGTAGTPGYMAPEQIRGESVTPATDVYALGCLLFELLTGQRPFKGNEAGTESAGLTAAERIRYAQQFLSPPDPRILVPNIPEDMAKIVLKCLAKDPLERYQDVRSIYDDAIQASKDLPADTISVPPIHPQPQSKTMPTWINRKTVLVFGSACVLILLAFLYLHFNRLAIPPAQGAMKTNTPQLLASTTQRLTLTPAYFTNNSIITPTLTQTSVPTPTSILLPTDTPAITYPAVPPSCTQEGTTWQSPIDKMIEICVPAGSFYNNSSYQSNLNSFWIDKYEVSNQQYALCVSNGTCYPPRKNGSHTRQSYYGNPTYDNYPVVWVSWDNANTYCAWANRRLPFLNEWRKAAQGPNFRVYPWGNGAPSLSLLNFLSNSAIYANGDTTPVDSYPQGASYYGVFNMGGNVMEWISDHIPSPYNSVGGAWSQKGEWAMISHDPYAPGSNKGDSDQGFRCVQDAQ